MNHRLYWIGAVALVCASYAHAKETTISTVQIALKTMGTHSTHRVTLPFAVYANLAHADLADLRVINADDEPVPFAFVDLPNPAVVDTLGVIVPSFRCPSRRVRTSKGSISPSARTPTARCWNFIRPHPA